MGKGKIGLKKSLSTIALVVAVVVALWELQWVGKTSIAFALIGLAAGVALLAWANLAGEEAS